MNMLEKWQGANCSKRGTCDRCGKRRQVGYIHYIGNEEPWREGTTSYQLDHMSLCSECWRHIPKDWHPCGCGG